MQKLFFTVCTLCLGVWACQDDTATWIGNWQGLNLYEAGDSVAVDPRLIELDLAADGRYRFVSTLNYAEAGTYRVEGDYLYTTDTTRQPSGEKVVEIQYLHNDSLSLLMDRAGVEQVLWLKRE